MSDTAISDTRERGDEPGKTRTWWHPLRARLLDYVLATGYSVFEEVLVGKLPLRVDILLIRRPVRRDAACPPNDSPTH